MALVHSLQAPSPQASCTTFLMVAALKSSRFVLCGCLPLLCLLWWWRSLYLQQAMVEDRVKSAVKGPQGSSIGASLFKSRASVLLYSAFSGGMVWGGGYTALKYFGLNG